MYIRLMTIERLRFSKGEAGYRGLSSLPDIIEANLDRVEHLTPGEYDIAPDLAESGYSRKLKVFENGTGILGPSNSPAVRDNPHNPMKEAQKLDQPGDVFFILTPDEPRWFTEIIFYEHGPSPKSSR